MKALALTIALMGTTVAADGFPEGGKFLNLSNQYVQTDTGEFVRYVPKVLVYQLPNGSIVHLKRGEAFPEWRLKQIELQSWVAANQDRREQQAVRVHNTALDIRKDKLIVRRDNLETKIQRRQDKGKRTRTQERKLRRVERRIASINTQYR